MKVKVEMGEIERRFQFGTQRNVLAAILLDCDGRIRSPSEVRNYALQRLVRAR